MSLDQRHPDRVLLAVTANDINFGPDSTPGLFISEDRGDTFTELDADLGQSDQAWQIGIDPTDEDSILLSIYSGAGGLYRLRL